MKVEAFEITDRAWWAKGGGSERSAIGRPPVRGAARRLLAHPPPQRVLMATMRPFVRAPLRWSMAPLALALVLSATRSASAHENPTEEDHYGRFRWGISGMAGPMLGDVSGGVGGVNARFGAQINEMVGIYAQPIAFAGVGFDASLNNPSATGLGLWGVGALCDFTLNDKFYLGAGPELLMGGVGETSTTTVSASGGTLFSVAGRAGLLFGTKKPTRRAAFQLGLDLHVVFGQNHTVVAPLLALGFEAY